MHTSTRTPRARVAGLQADLADFHAALAPMLAQRFGIDHLRIEGDLQHVRVLKCAETTPSQP